VEENVHSILISALDDGGKIHVLATFTSDTRWIQSCVTHRFMKEVNIAITGLQQQERPNIKIHAHLLQPGTSWQFAQHFYF
jgi:hypothetical protein